MPLQNEDNMLPETAIHFHPAIFLYFVILPTVGFSLLAIGYAWYQLKSPVLFLLKNDVPSSIRMKKFKEDQSIKGSFISDLKRTTLRSRKSLTFFHDLRFFLLFCHDADVVQYERSVE